MLQEFKKFAMRGNVVDLAIGVIIGAAFGKIVDSLVNDIIMPIIGRIFGGLDFTNYFIGLTPAASQAADLRRGQEGRRHPGLRQLHHRDGELHHHRLGAVPGDQGHEPPVRAGTGRPAAARAADQGAGAADRDPRSPEGAREQRSRHSRSVAQATVQAASRSAVASVEPPRQRVGDLRQRQAAFGRGDQALPPQQVLDRHRIGLGEQQRHERGERRPGGAGAGDVVGRRSAGRPRRSARS